MNFKKSKEIPSKHHNSKKPNPTNFSNLRSQNYLNQYDFDSNNEPTNESEQIFKLSADCVKGSIVVLQNREAKEDIC